MILFRLSKSVHANDLSGKGAETSGGRWNSKGIPLIYTSESRALCTAEIAVHTPLGNIPYDYMLITIEIPDAIKITHLDPETLPGDWKSYPHSHDTQLIGDNFVLRNEFLILRVPSVIVPGEFNYLLNPKHQDIKMIKVKSVESFNFDERLFVKGQPLKK